MPEKNPSGRDARRDALEAAAITGILANPSLSKELLNMNSADPLAPVVRLAKLVATRMLKEN